MKTLLDGYYRLLKFAITALMILLLVPVTLQILSRYTGLIPRYIWTEEIARFCFVWIIMIGATIAVRDDTHFLVDLLPDPATPRGRALLRIVKRLLMTAVAVLFVVYGYDFAAFGALQSSEISGLPMLAIYIAWPAAGVSWLLFLGEMLIEDFRILRTGVSA
jgi:TRAP-type C4-dicarboxylate transport system permease small subunit